ncbi:MAG TPA: hypothetical protein VJG90_02385 [Candidatus Nanoarchaeia archaeon]|nr:hypothetical protein [Candidatus Nanoarchaeia archaeon]
MSKLSKLSTGVVDGINNTCLGQFGDFSRDTRHLFDMMNVVQDIYGAEQVRPYVCRFEAIIAEKRVREGVK